MDHELKQRLIGAVVVTALCAIFIPMLFDDPIDNSGQQVSELSIPAPVIQGSASADKLPTDAEQVLKLPDQELAEAPADTIESTGAEEEIIDEPGKQDRSDDSLYTESKGYTHAEEPADEPDINLPTPHVNSVQDRHLATEAAKIPKAPVKETHIETAPKEPVKLKKAVESVRPLAIKKPDAEPVAAVATAPKQPTNAKSLAAAVAEAKTPAVTPKATPKLARWYVQVGSFSKKENAMSLFDSLHEQGLPASLDTVQTDKGITYRLRVGPELDGKKAAAMKARLDKQNIKAILISE